MLRCEGNSKHDRCTFPPGLQKDNNIFGYKEHKNHYYIVLAISERTNKPALNFSNDRFFFKSTAGYHYQNESWSRTDS